MRDAREVVMKGEWVLRLTTPRNPPSYFVEWSGIGPRCGSVEKARRYSSKEEATREEPRHSLCFWEPEEVKP